MSKRYVVAITKELEDWWGVDDLASDYIDDPDGFNEALLELLRDDVQAVIEDAQWEVKIVDD